MVPNFTLQIRRVIILLSVFLLPLLANANCPTIYQQPSNQTVCAGSQAVFTAGVSNATGYQWFIWNSSSGSWVALSNSSTYSGVTTATLTINNTPTSLNGAYYALSVGNQWCCSSTNSVNLCVTTCCPSIIQQPTNQTVCQGSQAIFSASVQNATGYQWYIWNSSTNSWVALSNNSTYSGVTTATLTISNTPTSLNGAYYALSVGNQSCCASTNSVNLCVLARPNVSAYADKNYICTGEGVTLTATGASSYVWQPGNFTGSSVVRYPSSTTTYTVTGTSSNGCTNTATVTVNVNANPNVSISGSSGTICSGSSATLTASGATNYIWLNNNQTGSSITVTPTSTTTYTVSGTNSSTGCTSTATFCVVVNPRPTVTTTATTTSVCSGNPTTITASGAVSYVWQPGNLTGSSITVSPTSTTTYTVTGTGANGCTNTATRTITVNNNNLTISAWADKNPICAGEGVTLSASGASTYVWQPGNISGSSIVQYPATTTTYTVTGTNAAGCTGTKTITITVYPNPTVTATANPATICSGSSTTLTATGATNYIWLNNNQTSATITVSPTATTTYTVSGTNSVTGCTSTATVAVTVLPKPSVSTSATATTICAGNPVTITASGTAVSYVWQPGNLTGSSITVSPTATTTYTVTGTGANGCTRTVTRTITVNSNNLAISVWADKNPICAGEGVTLSASGASTYVWQPGNITGSSIVQYPTTTTTYTVTGTNASGCTGTQTITITVHPNPSVTATANPATICSGSSTTLTATGATNYIWLNNNQTSATITVSPTATTTYTVSGTNSVTGCTSTATVAVTVLPKPSVSTSATATTICAGNPVTITASGTAVSYVWQPGNLTGSSITVSPTATTTYTVTGTGANGCTRTVTRTITVNSNNLAISVWADKNPICAGEGVTLSASGASTYVWQPGNLTGSSVFANPLTTTTYTVTGTNAAGCTGTQTITITVYPNPVVTATASPSSICIGSSTTLTATGATNYIWLNNNQTSATITVSPTATTTYTVSGTNSATGCTSTASVTVVVNPLPTITTSASSTTVCAGNPVTITATGGVSYTWQPGNLSGTSVTVNPTSTTTYTVTGTSANGCINTATRTITINNSITVTAASSASPICVGSSTTLSATGAATYVWMPGNLTGSSVSVSPTATTTYTVTGTSAAGCTGTATVNIVVNPLPVVAANTSASVICVGSSTTLTATGATSYTWMPGNLTGSSVSVSPIATTTYTVTGTNQFGCSSTATVNVVVNPLPVVAANTSASAICVGGSATLSATGATSYTWMPGNLTGASVAVSPIATTTYTVTGTNQFGCSSTATVAITVNPLPVVAANTSASAICVGGSATLSATGAATYVWMPGNLTGASVAVSPTATTTYTVTGTNQFGCSSTATVNVVVNPLPVVAANTSAAAICVGGSATLSATGAATYVWMPGNLTGSSVSVSPTATTTYTVTGTNQFGCSSTATVNVVVNPLPVVAANTSASAICVGGSATLSATGAATYVWMPGNLTGASVSVSPTATTTYTVTGTNANGCSSTATVAVTVNPLPVVAANTSASAICVGGSAILSATGAATYVWMPGNLTGSSVAVSPIATTTYTVTGTNANGCSSTVTVAVTVNPLPVVAANTSAAAICVGGSATLTATGATSYTWMPGNLTGSSVAVSPTATTTYTVTGTNANGCSSTATVNVVVNPLPVVAANTSASAICVGGSATLSATGATSYTWMPGNLTGASVAVSPIATTTYTVTGTNANGCSSTATVSVTVNPLPVVAANTSASAICVGGSATLSATGAATYVWMPGNLTGASVSVSPIATTTYTVTGTNQFGCSSTATVNVVVNPLPVVSANTSASAICVGGSATLSATGAATYVWMPGNLTGSSVAVSPTATTTYTVTGTNANGCSSTATVAVTVNPLPVVAANTSASAICVGGSATLSATGATSYTWMPGNLTGSSVSVSPTATTTYTVTGTNQFGCSSTATVNVVVNPLPVVAANTSASAICIGGSATLSATGATSYTWMPGNLTGASVSVSPIATTTYTVTGTNQFGCSSTATVNVVVNPLPVVAANTSASAICVGGSATLSATGATSYTWMPGNLTGSSVAVSPTATTTYTVTGTNANGCSSTATVAVTVNPLPVVAANTSASAICVGGSATLSATGAATYVWMPGNLTGASVAVSPTATTTYTVTGTNANGCSSTATVAVTVNPLPVVAANTSASAICVGGSATLTATGAATYVWMPGNLTGASVAVSPTATTTYTVTGTNLFGCSSTATVAVTVNPLPVVAANTSAAAICVGGSATLTATGATSYTWMPGNLTGSSVAVSPTATTTYTVTGTNANGCSSTTTVAVTVNPLPVVAANTSAAAICVGGSATLSATGAATYVWMPGNLTGASVSVSPTATTTYTVTGTNANGCSSTATVAVTVNPLPVVAANTSASAICVGGSATLTATGAATYVWMPGNLTGSSVAVSPTATTTYTVTGTNANGCSSTATVNVVVNPLPVVAANTSASAICFGGSATLSATGAATYVWMPGNLTGASVSVSPTATTTYTVTGTNANGCSSTATVSVTVNPLPIVAANTSASAICVGGSATLSATGAATYVWMPGNLTGASVSVSPIATTTYTVTGTNANGCSSTATVSVTVNPLPVVVITPSTSTSCEGSNVTLSASGAATYLWQPLNTTGSVVTDAPFVTTTYTVIGTSSAGCIDSATITINVNPLPPLSVSATLDTICVGGSSVITATGGDSYLWLPGNLTTASITVSPTVNTTYTVIASTLQGCIDSTNYEITIEPNPVFTVVAKPFTVCAGGTSELEATGNAVSYTWMPGNLTGSSVFVNPLVTTTYTVTGYSALGCTTTHTVTVTVLPAPTVTITSPDTVLCLGESTTLTGNGASTYIWLPSNQITSPTITVSPTVTTVYILVGISANGCRDTASVQVIVNPVPVVNASANTAAICYGGSAQLTASGNALSYVWMPGNMSGTAVTVNPTATTTYTVTGTNQFGCTTTATVTVVVNPLPVMAVNVSDSVICVGDAVTLSATGAATYTWQPGNLTGSSITLNPQTTTTYTVTGITANGCIDSAFATITVNPLPNVSVFSHFTTICLGNSITAYAYGADNYVWLPVNIASDNATFAPNLSTNYYVLGTDTNGCSDTANLNIIVNPLPVVNASASTVLTCAGETVTLSASGSAYFYAWQPGNLTGTPVTVNPTTTTSYVLMGVDTNSCIAYDTIVVNVNPVPAVTVNASATTICEGDTATLSASGAASYVWMPGNSTSATLSVTPAVTTTYTVIGTNAQGCSDTTQVTVVVNPRPEVTVFSHFTTICLGNSITAYAYGADNYVWMPINVAGDNATFAPNLSTNYYVLGTDTNGCSDTANLNIIVNPLPVVNASASTVATCAGQTVTLTASGSAYFYAWQPGNLTGTSVTVNPTVTTSYVLMGVDTNSCISYDTIVVTVFPTPNVQASASSATICTGESTTLNATGAATYVWMPGNLTGASLTVTPTATTTYTLTGTSADGCTSTAAVTVTVSPLASVTASGPSVICAGDTAVFTASGASSYVWMPGNLTGASITVTPATSTTYTVVGTTGSGCVDSTTVSISVNPLPAVQVTSHFSVVCEGQSITATAFGADTYVWHPGNTTGNTLTFTPASAIVYFVTGTDTNGCSDTAHLPIQVNPLPVLTTTASDTAVCSGSPVTLTVSGAAYYGWQPGNLVGSSITVNPTVTTTYIVSGSDTNSCVAYDTITVAVYQPQQVTVSAPSVTICAGSSAALVANNAAAYVWMPGNFTSASVIVTPSVTTTYTVTGYSADGCTSTATVTVFVNPNPVITATANDTAVCSGASTILTAGGAAIYTWTPGNLTGSSVAVTPATNTTYIVIGTDANGCSDSASVTVEVLPLPSVTVYSSASVICAGDSSTLSVTGASSYNWMPGNLSGDTISVSPASTTTYTVTGTGSNGCNDTAMVTVVVNPLPVVIASAANNTICDGNPAFLNASGAVNYNWMPGNQNGASVTVTPVSTTTYTVTGTDANGCSSAATVQITVNPLPAVTTSAPATICAGDSTSLSAAGAATYTWQPGNLSGAAVTVSPAVTTTYTVTGASADGCESSATVTVNVNALPSMAAFASASNICSGDSTVLTATGAATYNWMPGNLSGSSVTVTPAATTTYTVTGTSASGCTASAQVSVNVFATPVVAASATSSVICAGSSTQLSATGAVSYVWQPGNLVGSTLNITPAATTTYTVTGTSSDGCSASAVVTVTVNPLPVVSATAAASAICSGDSTQLTASGATVYTWMPGNLSGTTVTVSPVTATTYTVTGTDANGCSSTATVSVNVNQLPVLSTTASTASSCEGENVTLTASGAASYFWQPVGAPGAVLNDAPFVTTTYTVIGTSASGCVDSATVTVTVNPLPVIAITASDDTICAGGTTTITISASGGANYNWQPGNLTTSSITVTPAVTTTYSLVVSTLAGCIDSTTVEIVVQPNPVFVVSSKARTICSGTPLQLTATGNPTSYLWQPGNFTTSQITVTPQTTTTYTITGFSATGCTTTQVFTITVNPSPTVTVTSPDPVICVGQSAVLNASGAATWTWLPGLQTTSSITVSPLVTTTYSAIGIAATGGCRDTATIQVIVNPIPVITATPDDTIVCVGDSALINLSGGASYTWMPGNFVTGSSVYIAPQGYEVYTVTGTTAAGCSSTTTVTFDVEVCNGDTGERVANWIPMPNPSAGMFNLKGYSNGEEMVVKVYNAAGRLVYEENDYPVKGETTFPLDLSDLASGVYMIQIVQGESQQTVRVIVQR
jgi:Secretion system C-terminal sorting domain